MTDAPHRPAKACTGEGFEAAPGREEAVTPSHDLVERNFTWDAPDRLYVTGVTQHSTGEGWLYFAVVIDCFSRWGGGQVDR